MKGFRSVFNFNRSKTISTVDFFLLALIISTASLLSVFGAVYQPRQEIVRFFSQFPMRVLLTFALIASIYLPNTYQGVLKLLIPTLVAQCLLEFIRKP